MKKRSARISFFFFDQVEFRCDYLIMFQSLILNNKTMFHSDFLDEDMWNLLDTTYQMPDNFDFIIYEVAEEKYIGRPDLVSLDYYGDAMYADVICKLNGISNPFELNVGMLLALPAHKDINNFITTPSLDDRELDVENQNKPKPKTKNEKRKPNEAIVGNKRFKIDPAAGIIMY